VSAAKQLGSTEILVQAVPDIVSIEDICHPIPLDKRVLESEGQRTLPGSTQPGQPDGASFLVEQPFAVFANDVSLVPGNIALSDFHFP
jgi:hypothetical protein